MLTRTAVVDADTIAYISALNNQIEDLGELDMPSALAEVETKLNYIQQATSCEHLELHFSGSSNYRYDIYADYKANRRGKPTPAGLADLKQEICHKFDGTVHTDIEADDYVVWAKTSNPNYTLVSIDKDVLNSCVGRHYSYHFQNPKHVNVSLDTASEWAMVQTIKGDPTDNIKGVKNYGDIKTAKFIESIRSLSLGEKWYRVLDLYNKSETELVLNYSLVSCHLFNGSTVTIPKTILEIMAIEADKINKLQKSLAMQTSDFS